MQPDTRRRLNDLNRRFYAVTAEAFDATRGHPWPGWARLLPHIPARRPVRVLDVGCGNGRFGVYLAEQLRGPVHYTGLDNNPTLLDAARFALEGFKTVQSSFVNGDMIDGDLPPGPFDGVAAFGVVHHVPGNAARLAWVRRLAACVAPGGVLMLAAWRFTESEKLRSRLADWPTDYEHEPGDYLLDWRRGERALRYCHYVDDAEHARLVAATGLTEVNTYRADGHDGRMNRYSVLRRV
jgi:tRNA (uracil-5-)-methyltransferase TRM9